MRQAAQPLSELNALPTKIITVRTLWPQMLAGAALAASLVWLLLEPSLASLMVTLILSVIFIVPVTYITAMHLGNTAAMTVIPWVGGLALALVMVVTSGYLLPGSVLCIVAAVGYALSVSSRRVMYVGSILAFIALALCLLIAELHRLDLFPLRANLPSVAIDALLVLFVLGIGVDVLQRFWRFYNRINATMASLQSATQEVDRARIELEHRLNERTRLLEITRIVGSTQDLRTLLENTLVQLGTVVRYGHAGVMLLHDGALHLVQPDGSVTPPAGGTDSALPLSLAPHSARALSNLEPVIVDDVSHALRDTLRNGSAASAAPMRTGSWLGVPLIVRGTAIGLISITHPRQAHFNDHDADLALAFANQVAGIIENTRLREEATRARVHAERNRLARELHDSVSQALFGIVLGTRTAMQELGDSKQRAEAAMNYTVDLANTALTEMRALIFTLRPETLQNDGLIGAIEKHVSSVSTRSKAAIAVDLGRAEPPLSMDAKEALYRIAIEGLQNAIHHSQAKNIAVTLRTDGERVTLELRDDGVGFDPCGLHRNHLGLQSMRERAVEQRGCTEIVSAPGHGTIVRASLPICESEPAAHVATI
jgi:signal transduction histidine kinase